MPAGVGDRHSYLVGQFLHGSISVGEDVDDLDPAPATHGLGDPSELVEELDLYRAIWHPSSLSLLRTALSRTQLIP